MITKEELLANHTSQKLYENVEKTEVLFKENPVSIFTGPFSDGNRTRGYEIQYLPISKKFIILIVVENENDYRYNKNSIKLDIYEYKGVIVDKKFYTEVPSIEDYLRINSYLEKSITISCKYNTMTISLTLKSELQHLTFTGEGKSIEDAFYHAYFAMKKNIIGIQKD